MAMRCQDRMKRFNMLTGLLKDLGQCVLEDGHQGPHKLPPEVKTATSRPARVEETEK